MVIASPSFFRALLPFVGFMALVLTACGGSSGQTLTIFAGSSLTDAFNEAIEAFEARNPETNVVVNFAASSALRVQLDQGAHADLFASADERNMTLAQETGVIEGEPVAFAVNRLAIIVPSDSSRVATVQDLASPRLRLIIAAPQVPLGAYTDEALTQLAADPSYGPAFVDKVRGNVVSEALNARHATAIVQLGEVDAAIAYVTDAANPGLGLHAIPFPESVVVRPVYPIAVVKGSPEANLARAFIAFLRSEEGLATLARHGFGAP